MNLDFDSLISATKFAGELGAATGQIGKGLDAIKAVFQRSQGGTDPEIKLALSDLTQQVANAQLANAELKLQLATLQDQLTKVNAFQSDLNRYALWETPAGAIVYRLRDSAEKGEPLHYLCPKCIEAKTKSILQGHAEWKECPSCKTGYRIIPDKGPGLVRVNRGMWGDI